MSCGKKSRKASGAFASERSCRRHARGELRDFTYLRGEPVWPLCDQGLPEALLPHPLPEDLLL